MFHYCYQFYFSFLRGYIVFLFILYFMQIMTSSSSLVRLGSPVVVLASAQTGQDLFFDWDFGDQASLDGSASNVPDVTT